MAQWSVPINYCGEGEEDISVCPCAARFQCTCGVFQQHVQRRLVHYYLQKESP